MKAIGKKQIVGSENPAALVSSPSPAAAASVSSTRPSSQNVQKKTFDFSSRNHHKSRRTREDAAARSSFPIPTIVPGKSSSKILSFSAAPRAIAISDEDEDEEQKIEATKKRNRMQIANEEGDGGEGDEEEYEFDEEEDDDEEDEETFYRQDREIFGIFRNQTKDADSYFLLFEFCRRNRRFGRAFGWIEEFLLFIDSRKFANKKTTTQYFYANLLRAKLYREIGANDDAVPHLKTCMVELKNAIVDPRSLLKKKPDDIQYFNYPYFIDFPFCQSVYLRFILGLIQRFERAGVIIFLNQSTHLILSHFIPSHLVPSTLIPRIHPDSHRDGSQ